MTCFKLGNKTIRQICLEEGLSYHNFYRQIEAGQSIEYALSYARKTKNIGTGGIQRKYMVGNISLYGYCKGQKKLYDQMRRQKIKMKNK